MGCSPMRMVDLGLSSWRDGGRPWEDGQRTDDGGRSVVKSFFLKMKMLQEFFFFFFLFEHETRKTNRLCEDEAKRSELV